jgi:hypothetical protein
MLIEASYYKRFLDNSVFGLNDLINSIKAIKPELFERE